MKLIFLYTILSMISYGRSINKVVYGTDERMDIYQSPNKLYKELADSTASMILDSVLVDQGDSMSVVAPTLDDQFKLCSDVRFRNQLTAAACSGFLVSETLLVTAGHCINKLADCESSHWVFGYGNIDEEKTGYIFPKTEIYKCVKLIERNKDITTGNDYSLVMLDRPVKNHSPLKYRTEGVIADNSNLVVIGNPSGLPTKIADGANIRNNSNKYFFQTNLDTFNKNSGSAVFDADTGLVEGILVRGDTDYIQDISRGCTVPNVCPMDGCHGEEVTRIMNIKALKNKKLI